MTAEISIKSVFHGKNRMYNSNLCVIQTLFNAININKGNVISLTIHVPLLQTIPHNHCKKLNDKSSLVVTKCLVVEMFFIPVKFTGSHHRTQKYNFHSIRTTSTFLIYFNEKEIIFLFSWLPFHFSNSFGTGN